MAEKLTYIIEIDPRDAINGASVAEKTVRRMDAVLQRGKAEVVSLGRGFVSMGTNAAAGLVKFAAPLAGIAAFGAAFQQFSQQIPAVQQSLFQMGVVIRNNLFWPLMRELLPALMSMSVWVRDNRDKFLQVGGVIVNVFKVIAAAARGFVNLASAFFNRFYASVSNGGRVTLRGILKVIDFILLKIAILFAITEALILPLVESIGNLLGLVFRNAVVPFIEGLAEGLMEMVGPALVGIIGAFKELFDVIAGLFGKRSADIFRFVGNVIGTVMGMALKKLLKNMISNIRAVTRFMKIVIIGGKKVIAIFGDIKDSWTAIWEVVRVAAFVMRAAFRHVARGAAHLLVRLSPILMIFSSVAVAIQMVVMAFRRLKDSEFIKSITGLLDKLSTLTKKLKEFGKEVFQNIVLELATAPIIGKLISRPDVLKSLGVTPEQVEEYKREKERKEREGGTQSAIMPRGSGDVSQNNIFNIYGGDARETAGLVYERQQSLARQFMSARARSGEFGVGARA